MGNEDHMLSIALKTAVPPHSLLPVARYLLMSRRRRDTMFSEVEFGEPAWDMLLDLYVQHAQGRRVSTHNLCDAAMVPATTALRWIGAMVEEGQLTRQPDPSDRRRVFIAMTPRSFDAIETYLLREGEHMKAAVGSLI